MSPCDAPENLPVGDQRDGVLEALPDYRCGDCEHLPHPGASLRPLVAHDDHVPGRLSSCAMIAWKASSSLSKTLAGPLCVFLEAPGDLEHGSLGREVPPQYGEASSLPHGAGQRCG